MNAKSVLITGASRGIGLEFVSQILRLPKAPKWLFAACRNPDQATELQKIAASNPAVKVLKLEVTSVDDIQSAVTAVEKEVGDEGLNLLISNAGLLQRIGLDDVTEEVMMEHFRVNCVAPLMISKAFLPLLKKAASTSSIEGLGVGRAAVVNVTSKMASIDDNSSGGSYPYRSSKTALNQITRNLSIELKPLGILAMVIHPGWVQTNMGGPNAKITTTESVSNMVRVLGELSEENTGTFLNYDGKPILW